MKGCFEAKQKALTCTVLFPPCCEEERKKEGKKEGKEEKGLEETIWYHTGNTPENKICAHKTRITNGCSRTRV